ncbi:MAG: energy-coupling factor transporter transmembrane protein EcfT [Oscillospiraceae bacterium]|jgi:energy-coupling factor transport system permease protein|nr:energy-coupling factor transporter transmembrane protein EcfT [Oscillospiraceae bacterium]
MREITIGQYYSGKSVLHRMDARMKLALTVLFMAAIFLCKSFPALAIAGAAGILIAALSGVPVGMLLRSLRPILMLVLFTSVLNILYVQGEDTTIWWRATFHIGTWTPTITKEGVFTAIFTTSRIIILILVSSILTYTTTPSMLTTGLERLLRPLNKLHVPVGIFAMMMTLALRFVPTLIEEADRIMSAQKSRGANLDTGSILKRIRAFVPILVPMFVSAFRCAAELANAMESRCYTGVHPRTSAKVLKLCARDWCAFGFVVLMTAGIAVCGRLFPAVL